MELAKLNQDKAQSIEHKKDVASQFTATEKRLDAEISNVSRIVANNQEYKDIDCEWLYDWEAKEKTLIRKDTSEVVLHSAIELHERQEELGLDEDLEGDDDGKDDGAGTESDEGEDGSVNVESEDETAS